MLLGLATIFAGSLDDYFNRPRAVGFILLFCLFTLTHINRDIESGLIARGQAELRAHIELYEKTLNGNCLLSSREQLEQRSWTIFNGNGRGPLRGRARLDDRNLEGLAQGVGRSVSR